MRSLADWWCPQLLSGPGNYLRKNADADLALKMILPDRRRVAIQAGGHIGTWPVYLADRFQQVYTFEPDVENFACLVRNTYERGLRNVFAARGVLGQKRRPVSMRISPKSTGQHRIRPDGPAITPTYRIDDLGLEQVDAIFLDVEGTEIPALQGAADTLKRCRPVVMAEENKRCADQGYRLGELEIVMRGFGYQVASAVNEDLIFVPLASRSK